MNKLAIVKKKHKTQETKPKPIGPSLPVITAQIIITIINKKKRVFFIF